MDTISYTLCYGQEPLVQTFVDQLMHGNELPSEQKSHSRGDDLHWIQLRRRDHREQRVRSIEDYFVPKFFRTYRDEEVTNINADGPHFQKVNPGRSDDDRYTRRKLRHFGG